MKNIRVTCYVVLLLAILGFAGCKHPTEPTSQPKDIDIMVDGDLPLYIEYSYDDALYGRQAAKITRPSTSPQGWEIQGLAKEGSAFRLYAISMMSHGHVYAHVLVFTAPDGQTMLLGKTAQSDSGSVEITGTVP